MSGTDGLLPQTLPPLLSRVDFFLERKNEKKESQRENLVYKGYIKKNTLFQWKHTFPVTVDTATLFRVKPATEERTKSNVLNKTNKNIEIPEINLGD